MSENPEQQHSPADSEQAALSPFTEAAAPVAVVKPVKSRSGTLALLLSLLVLPVVAVLGFRQLALDADVETLRQQYANLLQVNAGNDGQIATLQQAQEQLATSLQENLQQQLAAANARIAGQAEQLATLARELDDTRQRISQTSAGTTGAVMLSEAASLLRLAQQALLTSGDVRAAIDLFAACDALLLQLNDPSLFTVREILAQELAALRALPEIDMEGIYLQLGAQNALLDSFSVLSEEGTNDFEVTAPATTTALAVSWFERALAVLNNYFVVTRQDGNVVPLMTEGQKYLVRSALHLQLEQARLALLQHQTALYQAALDNAMTGITEQLQGSTADDKEKLLATLQMLRNTPIEVDIPAVNNTLAALQQVLTKPAADGTAP